jgi:tRNA pseudouridine55 synthase
LDGALVIDKPSGLTSHDVVAALRRALALSRVGHAGTLDPMATGVLPVLIGRATRLAQFVSGADKTYDADVTLTFETDTDDATGAPVTAPHVRRLSCDDVERGLEGLTGPVLQVPPAYSAKKVGGRRAYSLARESRAAVLAPVEVVVRRLELIAWNDPVATLHVVCSAGCYVRALARDLGRALGTGGHLSRLRRLASGHFRLQDAVPLDDVLRDPQAAQLHLIPSSGTVAHLPTVGIAGPALDRVRHGAEIDVEDAPVAGDPEDSSSEFVKLVGPDGVLIGIGRRGERPGSLHPVVVLM